MKSIETELIITSVRSRADGSIGLSAVTPELNNKQKVAFMDLHNINLRAFFDVLGAKVEDNIKVDRQAGEKTPSERLRAVIHVYWTQQGSKGDFDKFYRMKMNNLINLIKDKLI